MPNEKELVCLTKDPFIPGVEAIILPQSKGFREVDLTEVYLDDPWGGVLDQTVLPHNAVTYAAYTAALPPAWGDIMFNAARTAFICGTAPFWGGKVMGFVTPVGSVVLTS